jgi:hypothetical protein
MAEQVARLAAAMLQAEVLSMVRPPVAQAAVPLTGTQTAAVVVTLLEALEQELAARAA